MEPGTHKETVVGTFQVPHDAKPGQYGITVLCDNGKEAKGDLAVKATAPIGHVKTGVGGSIGPDSTQIAAGVAVLAAAAVGGSWLLRRRASGAQSS
jgi:MYXO-CTERM domain-containing protein